MSLYWRKRPTFNAVQVNTFAEVEAWVGSLGPVDLVSEPTWLSEVEAQDLGTRWRINFRWSSTDGPGGSTHMGWIEGAYGDYALCQYASMWSLAPNLFAEQYEPVTP